MTMEGKTVVDGSEGAWEVGKAEPRSRKGLGNGGKTFDGH